MKSSTHDRVHRPTRLFLIFRGPNYDLDTFGRRLLAISERFEGVCVMGYTATSRRRLGTFDLVTTHWTAGLSFTIRHLMRIAIQAIRERFSERPADLVVSADPLKGGLYGYVASKIIGCPFLAEVNGDFADPANYMDNAGALAQLKRRLMIAIGTFVLKRADGIRVLYPRQLDFLGPQLLGKVIHTAFEYVDLSAFRDLGEQKLILFAGFPFYVKGVDVLISAFKKVAEKYPDWRLRILGWFPDPRLLQSHIGDHPQIEHHPPVPYNEMPIHMGACAILVLPSRTEAMGRVLLEAMAAGKARIASNVGGIPTVIEDGVDGLLFESGNVDMLASHLDLLMSNSQVRQKLGKAGQRRVAIDFTLERYLDNLEALYSSVIARTRK